MFRCREQIYRAGFAVFVVVVLILAVFAALSDVETKTRQIRQGNCYVWHDGYLTCR